MNNIQLKVIELRNYLIKPGMCRRFTDYFEEHFIDSQTSLGGYVLGQFRIDGEDDKFFWIRGFEDMQTRLSCLRGFYEEGKVWKEFGPGANEMILDSDDVYLLKPLSKYLSCDELANKKGIVVVEFYFASPNQLEQLTALFQAECASLQSKPTLLISEMTTNDFPRLPVTQDPNLLVSIGVYDDESDYQSQARQSTEMKNRMRQLIARENTLILYPTAKSFIGNARTNNDPAERRLGKGSQ